VVMVTGKREEEVENAGTMFLARAKSNIGPDDGGFAYDLLNEELYSHPGVIISRIRWGAVLEGTARDLLADAEGRDEDEAGDVVSFLHELLADGPMPSREVMRHAKEAGFAWRTPAVQETGKSHFPEVGIR